MTIEYRYSDAQFAALRSLARAHGHGWACERDMPTEHPIRGCEWTSELIAEMYAHIAHRDRWESWQWGVAAPDAPAYHQAPVCHTSSTGRVSWQVDHDGRVGIVISRPDPRRSDVMVRRPGLMMMMSERVDVPVGRSGVVVLSALVDGCAITIRTPETRDGMIPDVSTATWSSADGPRAEARHGDALLDAITALTGRPAALAALLAAGVHVSAIDVEHDNRPKVHS